MEILAGEDIEDQRGDEDVQIDAVRRRHVRSVAAPVQIADQHQAEHRRDDGQDLGDQVQSP